MDRSTSLSVVINNYNYGQYLPQALDSALCQLHDGDEVVIVDDGSTDASRTVLEHYQSRPQCRVIYQENQGHVQAVCRGIEAAGGDVIVLLDSDDYFLDGYLARLREIYSSQPDISFVMTRAEVGGDGLSRIRATRRGLRRIVFGAGRIGPTKWSTIGFGEFVGVPTSGNSLRRSSAVQMLPLISTLEDLQTGSILLAKFFGVSRDKVRLSRYSADGLIVRYASIFQQEKYYDDRPGFMYRVHKDNKFAQMHYLSQRYQIYVRKRNIRRKLVQEASIDTFPSAEELRAEILGRALPVHPLRRLSLRLSYSRIILFSRGSLWAKIRALAALPRAGEYKDCLRE